MPCPTCGRPTVRVDAATLPWCPSCEWNLRAFDPALAPWRGLRVISRWGYRRGQIVDERQRVAVMNGGRQPPTRSRTEIVFTLLSTALAGLALALVALAGWLWFKVPPALALFATLILLALAWLFVPTSVRTPRGIPPEQGVEFRRLVSRIAEQVGTQAPSVIVFNLDVNASVRESGLRRTPVLTVGIPLWLSLPPQARIAVLAHELGHLVNRDPARGRWSWPAQEFLGRISRALGGGQPGRLFRRTIEEGVTGLLPALLYGGAAIISTLAASGQYLVNAIARPDSRRAEYYADAISLDLAGTDGFLEAQRTLLVADDIIDRLIDRAPRLGASDLPEAALRARQGALVSVPLRRQLSVRHDDLWSSHPSGHSRLLFAESQPRRQARIAPTDEQWQAIDAELAPLVRQLYTLLLGTRDHFA